MDVGAAGPILLLVSDHAAASASVMREKMESSVAPTVPSPSLSVPPGVFVVGCRGGASVAGQRKRDWWYLYVRRNTLAGNCG